MKNWIKKGLAIAGFIGCFSLVLTGCGSTINIKNNSENIVFNGGIVSVLEDDLIFSNSYVNEDISSIESYNSLANSSYLATVNKEDFSNDKYLSAQNVQNIKNEVTGFNNMYNFVYKDYVYYASPNKHQTSSNQYVFTYVSFFKCTFDGGNQKELMTTSSYDSAVAQVRALKFGNNAYLVVYDGKALNFINLSNDQKTLISSKVTSVAFPQENENWNGKIYYTEDKDNAYGQAGNAVYQYDFSNYKKTDLKNNVNQTISFVGRSEDYIFFTMKNELSTASAKTYILNSNDLDELSINNAGKVFYSDSVNDIYGVGDDGNGNYEGYIFSSSLTGSAQILYVSLADQSSPSIFLTNDSYSNILFTYQDLVYYSSSTGIYYKSVLNNQNVAVVENMTIISDKVGYDFYESGNLKTIYFYAEREYAEDDETEEDERDTNYYLYSTNADGSGEVSLIGQTDNPVEDGPNVALIASLSVVGGLLVIGGIVATVIIVRKKRGYWEAVAVKIQRILIDAQV